MSDNDKPTESNLKSNPYPGLRPFQFEESHLFFGRDEQRSELLNRLRDSRFLAVVGTSGSGKSSLVRAGLLPGLLAGFMDRAGTRWRIADTRPGGDPIGRLAEALDKKGVLSDEVLEEGELSFTETNLRRSAQGLVTAVKEAQLPKSQRLLVLVDQFEELFRFVDETSHNKDATNDASAFVKLLLTAASQTEVPIYVVLTMRTDFLGECARFRDLPEAINDGQYLIPRLTRSQRREAIVGPAAIQNVHLSRILINRLLNDVGEIPDHLPILQHALMRTWEVSQDNELENKKIMLADYLAVGGMQHALSRHAESIYKGLAEGLSEKEGLRKQRIAERMFKCLTEESDVSLQTRRLATLEEISHVVEADIDDVIDVIDQFRQQSSSFLMPPIEEKLLPETYIDISHESLIRNWTTLKGWAHKEAISADIYQRLAHAARLYKNDKDELLVGRRLRMALEWESLQQPNEAWALRYDADYHLAMKFLDKSEIKKVTEEELVVDKKRVKNIFRIGIFTAIVVAFLYFVLDNLETTIQNKKSLEADRLLVKSDNLLIDALSLMHEDKDLSQAKSKEDHENVLTVPKKAKIIGLLSNSITDGSRLHLRLAETLIVKTRTRDGDLLERHGDEEHARETLLFNVMSKKTKKDPLYIKGSLKKLEDSFNKLDDKKERKTDHPYPFAKKYTERERERERNQNKWVESGDEKFKEIVEFLYDITWLLILGLVPCLRWFSLSRWRRGRVQKILNEKTGKANPVWRIFAALSDLAIGGVLGLLSGSIVVMTIDIIATFETISMENDNIAIISGVIIGTLVTIVYLLLRDNLKFRFRRSPGKILFGLCPMTLTGEGFTFKSSLKYNSFFVGIIPALSICIFFAAYGALDWMWLSVVVPMFCFIWLILAFIKSGRTLGDRFANARIVDVRSEPAQLLRAKNIASLSGRKTHVYDPLASEASLSDPSTGFPVEANSSMEELDEEILLATSAQEHKRMT
jgi:hypothetical protein